MTRKKLSAALRHKIYESYGGKCAYCGQAIEFRDMQVDHIVPLHLHGVDNEENYLPACRICNHYKRTLTVENFRRELGLLKKRLKDRVYIYRLAIRYGLISENNDEIKFYFEIMNEVTAGEGGRYGILNNQHEPPG